MEYFWRCLVSILGRETKFTDYDLYKKNIYGSIDNILKDGDCFELIDGENLEFKG